MKKILTFVVLSAVVFSCSTESAEVKETTEAPAAKASFELVTNHGLVDENQTLTITNTSRNASSYHWDFGNGVMSKEQQPNYKFPMHGYYNITLTVTDKDGNQDRYTKEVGVLCKFGGDH